MRASNEGSNQVEWQSFSVEEYEKTRAQNVPKTKVEQSKVVEIVRHQKKVLGVKNKA
jgi:hypothetical protein